MPKRDNSPEFVARDRYEVPANPTLDDVANVDSEWMVEPEYSINPKYSNYFEVGDKVVGPLGDRGVIVGVEYLGKVRKPIYWVKWENSPTPQPELGEALVRANLLKDMLFKRVLSSVGGHVKSRDEVLMTIGAYEGIIIPDSYGFVSDLGTGLVHLAMYVRDKDSVVSHDYEDLTIADVFGMALSLRIPVKLSWLDNPYPPQVAFNAVMERGLI